MGREIKNYYTVLKHMSDVFDQQARKMPAPTDTLKNLCEWQKKAKNKLWNLLGLDKMKKCPLNPKILESVKMDGYRRDHIIIQTQPGVYMPFFALIPENIKYGEKRPAYMNPMGHGPGKFMSLDMEEYDGYTDWKERMSKIFKGVKVKSNFDIDLAKRGYIVFASDAVGAGERREYMDQGEDKFGVCSHDSLNNAAICMGFTVLGMEVWDLIRLTDYISTREDCDGRVAVGGVSGGGHQSMFFAALDERINAVITSGWFYGFKDSHLFQPHNCNCNYVPKLWNYFDCCDIGSMIAPRPFHIESGAHDHLNSDFVGIGNVISQVSLSQKSYDLYESTEKLLHFIHPGVHEWCGDKAFEFLEQYLPIKEQGVIQNG